MTSDEIGRSESGRVPEDPEAADTSPSGPDETPREAADSGEVQRLLGQLDERGSTALSVRDLAETFQLNTRILQYIHDSHTRLVKVLERGDRSEMYIQATEALNRTFRNLHESQQELAARLKRERRQLPALTAVSAVLAGTLVLIAVFWILEGFTDDVGSEVGKLAAARTRQEDSARDSLDAQARASAQLIDTINQGFAANRVLAGENRAREGELAALKSRVATLEDEIAAGDRRREEVERLAERHRAENERLAVELDAALCELVRRDTGATELKEILGAKDSGKKPDGAANIGSEPEAEPVVAAGQAEAPEPPAAAETRSEPEPAVLPLDRPEVRALNSFLRDCGVVNLRLLRCEGVRDGALRRVVLEVRSEQGFPIGIHEAKRARLAIDPVALSGQLVLEEGVSVIRGIRTPFLDDRLGLDVAAVLAGSWDAPDLAGFVHLTRPAPDPAVPERMPVALPFDPRATLARLNSVLRQEGYDSYEFFLLDGVDGATLKNVRLHHYGPGRNLEKTVVAAACRAEIDVPERRVVLVFLDGHHVTGGREVPFFRGRGQDVGCWTLEIVDADVERWARLLAELSAESR